jgi:hypothetical protein
MLEFLSKNCIALAALVLSAISICISSYVAYRDRENLKVRAVFYPNENENFKAPPKLKIEAVNSGRRPIILTAIGVDYPDRKYTAMSIGKETGGITLSEKQNYICDMDEVEFVRISVKDTQRPINLWVRDTMGVRHYAKGAKKGLRLFYQSKAK